MAKKTINPTERKVSYTQLNADFSTSELSTDLIDSTIPIPSDAFVCSPARSSTPTFIYYHSAALAFLKCMLRNNYSDAEPTKVASCMNAMCGVTEIRGKTPADTKTEELVYGQVAVNNKTYRFLVEDGKTIRYVDDELPAEFAGVPMVLYMLRNPTNAGVYAGQNNSKASSPEVAMEIAAQDMKALLPIIAGKLQCSGVCDADNTNADPEGLNANPIVRFCDDFYYGFTTQQSRLGNNSVVVKTHDIAIEEIQRFVDNNELAPMDIMRIVSDKPTIAGVKVNEQSGAIGIPYIDHDTIPEIVESGKLAERFSDMGYGTGMKCKKNLVWTEGLKDGFYHIVDHAFLTDEQLEEGDIKPVNLCFIGVASTGKSYTAEAIADYTGLPFARVVIDKSSESDRFTTVVKFQDGKIMEIPTEVLKRITEPSVVFFDEFNTGNANITHANLSSFLETPFELTLQDGTKVKRHPRCIAILAANIGTTGTNDQNEATITRLGYTIEFNPINFYDVLSKKFPYMPAKYIKWVADCADRSLAVLDTKRDVTENEKAFVCLRTCERIVTGLRDGMKLKHAQKLVMESFVNTFKFIDSDLADMLKGSVVDNLPDIFY